jgi:hypothetical protein
MIESTQLVKQDTEPKSQELRRSATIQLSILIALSLLVSLCLTFFARPGTAGDEPAHFQNVVFYARMHTLPVLGYPHVSYEGQMGPVYYTLAAMVYAVFEPCGELFSFLAVRCAGLIVVPVLIVLSYRLARECCANRTFAMSTACFMALNPSLVSINASVQNDTLSIVLAMLAGLLVIRYVKHGKDSIKGAIWLGFFVSLGILTKATVVFLAMATCFYLLVSFRMRSIKLLFAFGLTIVFLTGWWFLRNYQLYGDFTAQKALTLFNYGNNPTPQDLTQWKNLSHWLWIVETYYWLPVQYYRDLFHAPLWLRAVVGTFTGLGLSGCAVCLYQLRSRWRDWGYLAQPATFMVVQYATCLAIYTYSCMHITYFAPRVVFPTIVGYAMMVCFGGIWWASKLKVPNRAYLASLTACLVLMDGMLVSLVHSFPVIPSNTDFFWWTRLIH